MSGLINTMPSTGGEGWFTVQGAPQLLGSVVEVTAFDVEYGDWWRVKEGGGDQQDRRGRGGGDGEGACCSERSVG